MELNGMIRPLNNIRPSISAPRSTCRGAPIPNRAIISTSPVVKTFRTESNRRVARPIMQSRHRDTVWFAETETDRTLPMFVRKRKQRKMIGRVFTSETRMTKNQGEANQEP
ncbi:unnamed protein product [Dovyalis caffra]|uniref:Uncharacterized protein n=1 Tax=Dovyalis caffra TaxID=77055 RepID=A0AAV1SRC3_9ROSI|nr:unnamed protein product [Dovyalis caffra]